MTKLTGHAILMLMAFAGLCMAAGEALAAERGHLNARANRPVETHESIAVQAGEMDERYKTLAIEISNFLRDKGFKISDTGTMTLQYRISESQNEPEKGKSRVSLEGQGGSGSKTRSEFGIEIQMGRKGARPAFPKNRLQLEFFLFVEGQTPIWSATVTIPKTEQDDGQTLMPAIQFALDRLGKTESSVFELTE